jgi:hypothetical protein
MIDMEFKEIIEYIEVHQKLNYMAVADYKREGNEEMAVAHSCGVTALEMLKRDLYEDYGVNER